MKRYILFFWTFCCVLILCQCTQDHQSQYQSETEIETRSSFLALGGGGGGETIARCSVEAPPVATFVLRCNIPVPPNTYPLPNKAMPFGVKDYDGQIVQAQVDIVSRYGEFSEGADIVEIIAEVNQDPNNMSPGHLIHYEIVNLASPQAPPKNNLKLARQLVRKIENDGPVKLQTKDFFGHQYELPFIDQNVIRNKTLTKGPFLNRIRTTGVLKAPNAPVGAPNGALGHFLSAITYYSVSSTDPDILLVTFHIHNGLANPKTKKWNKKLYFDALTLSLPSGWVYVPDISDPFTGTNIASGNENLFDLVTPLPQGKYHVIPEAGQFVRKGAIVKQSEVARAMAIMAAEGLGVAERGTNSAGTDYYSWWNPLTARFFPQKSNLPLPPSSTHASIINKLNNQYNTIQNTISSGIGSGNYPYVKNVMGWAHTWGVPYMGMTGGSGINTLEGIHGAIVGNIKKEILYSELRHRMNISRDACLLKTNNGNALGIKHLKTWHSGLNQEVVPIEVGPDAKVVTKNVDPLGITNAPSYQVQAVQNAGVAAPYESELFSMDCHDFQHRVRNFAAATVLSYLANDPLAKDHMRYEASIYRLSFNLYPIRQKYTGAPIYGPGGSAYNSVKNKPNIGNAGIGRATGWGAHSNNAAYNFRNGNGSEISEWLAFYIDLTSKAANCTGKFISKPPKPKGLPNDYSSQTFEETYLANGIYGAMENFRRTLNSVAFQDAQSAVMGHIYGSFDPTNWLVGNSEPAYGVATAPGSNGSTPYCGLSAPAAFWTGYVKGWMYNSVRLGLEISPNDSYIIDHLTLMTGQPLGNQCAAMNFFLSGWNSKPFDKKRLEEASILARLQLDCGAM